ncbi:phage tail protein [Stutzerimonas stutzeri]|uniref:Phage tail protein n=1 Tax=Stutzerimonas stutzeri TaxID=316 RepID=A0AA42P4K7_STUST|nr:phage tail protein [Stutzerimonas stutzeri]MDH1234486.1 phage tail protein [Stutzerimonas stutzeri]
MAVSLPNGAVVSIASAYAAPITITAVSNANPAVASAVGHGLANGDIVEVTSGWSRLNSRVARVANVTADTFELEGINTTSTNLYPVGGGAGSVRKVSTWQQITQVLEFTTSGGEQQFVTYSFLEEDVEHQIPTVKSASSFAMTIGDDAELPWYSILSDANDDRIPRAVSVVLPSGSAIYYNGYVTLNKTPTLTKNELMGLQSTVSLTSEPMRYAA